MQIVNLQMQELNIGKKRIKNNYGDCSLVDKMLGRDPNVASLNLVGHTKILDINN